MNSQEIEAKLKQAGLDSRPGQMQMLNAVRDTFNRNNILCVEAGTGTGKTLAYTLGAYLSKPGKKKIIISTATITLQEQLINKDLPLLQDIFGEEISFALGKGRRRYVCQSRLYENNDLFASEDEYEDDRIALQGLLETRDWRGDRDKLTIGIKEKFWQQVSTDARGCTAGRCFYYETCAFFRARKKLHAAEILVVNHSLLLSDLSLGGGTVLPAPEDCLYIIDECHHLPEKALSHFAKRSAVMGSLDWINTINKQASQLSQHIKLDADWLPDLQSGTKELVALLKTLHDYLNDQQNEFGRENYWLIDKPVAELRLLAENLAVNLKSIFQHTLPISVKLEDVLESKKEKDSEETLAFIKVLQNWQQATERLQNALQTWQGFLEERVQGQAPKACWFSLRENRESGECEFSCHVAPINISQELKSLFWDKISHGAVLCSATIQGINSFQEFIRKSGLKDDPRLATLALASPFAFAESTLFLPSMKTAPEGQKQTDHLNEVISMLPELCELHKSGVLVLFASRYAMEEAFAELPASFTKKVLMQDQLSKQQLIDLHKRRIDQNEKSILFGLASLAEGLDLPGDYCNHVIIHKLPFAMPQDPIAETRYQWLKKNGKNPFQLVSLPEAASKLIQYSGRLIRKENDQGTVTILDKRLYTKHYGKVLLNALPPFQRLIDEKITASSTT